MDYTKETTRMKALSPLSAPGHYYHRAIAFKGNHSVIIAAAIYFPGLD